MMFCVSELEMAVNDVSLSTYERLLSCLMKMEMERRGLEAKVECETIGSRWLSCCSCDKRTAYTKMSVSFDLMFPAPPGELSAKDTEEWCQTQAVHLCDAFMKPKPLSGSGDE